MPISIEDLGDKRRLSVEGVQWDGRNYRHATQSLETVLSVLTLEEFVRLNGEQWVINDLRRTESVEYVERAMRAVFKHFPPQGEPASVLDFGCGTGTSAVIVARCGHKVTGVDAEAKYLKAARMRVEDYGLSHLAIFLETKVTDNLPFEDGSFDGVLASGVFEHIPPQQRDRFAVECWRLLKPGGLFYVMGSPNRFWPLEYHTTNLPFVHWLPMWLALPIVRRFCKRIDGELSRERLIDGGFIGVNTFALLKWLPDSRLCETADGNVGIYFRDIMNPDKGSKTRRAVYRGLHLFYKLMYYPFKLFRIPVQAFFPYTYLAIRKNT